MGPLARNQSLEGATKAGPSSGPARDSIRVIVPFYWLEAQSTCEEPLQKTCMVRNHSGQGRGIGPGPA